MIFYISIIYKCLFRCIYYIIYYIYCKFFSCKLLLFFIIFCYFLYFILKLQESFTTQIIRIYHSSFLYSCCIKLYSIYSIFIYFISLCLPFSLPFIHLVVFSPHGKCTLNLHCTLQNALSLHLTGSNSLHIYTIPQFSLTSLLTLNLTRSSSELSEKQHAGKHNKNRKNP